MSVASAALHEAIYNAWVAASIDETIRDMWSEGDEGYPTLHDGEATPGQPFPYVVFEVGPLSVTARMSGSTACRKETIQDVPVTFRVHAEQSVAYSAKQNAITIAEEVMKIFGGHPTAAPSATMTMTSGDHLITQYQTDYGLRTGDTTHLWTVEYTFRLDMPIAR